MTREVTAIAPWYGSARMVSKHAGESLKGCRWVAIPFAGGLPEVRYTAAH